MPTVRRIGSARFFFYSNEGTEPPHIHVKEAALLPSSGCSLYPWLRRVGSEPTTFVAWNGWWLNIATSKAWHEFFRS